MVICVEWVKKEQGKHFCKCGCGESIMIKPQHHGIRGIPKFIRHHSGRFFAIRSKWISENQGRHRCACGCGQLIIITKYHRDNGIPKCIKGHCRGLPLSIWTNREQGLHFCQCGCGKAIPIRPEHRRHEIPKFLHGHNAKGKNNPAWQGGKSKTYMTRRRAMVPESWRQSIYLRDGFQCVCCSSFDQPQAHHIISFSKRPDLGNELWNGITLCKQCHSSVKGHEALYQQELFALLSRS